jgi:hypothetical protein
MATRRKLTRIRLDKIAAVDLPCQEHATVAIIKRAPGDPTLAIAKKTFEEALNAQLVSERISDVFWRAFDNQYAVREAFRTALADELAEGGDGTAATAGFTAAMQTIAQTAATLAREAGQNADTNLESAVEQAVEKWLVQQEEQTMKITTKAALTAAVSAFAIAKSTVADANAIIDAAVALDAVDALDANEDLAKMAKARSTGNDQVVKGLQREVAILKMADPIRKHFDGLDAAGQTAFLALSADDQNAAVEKANATDPVVYTTADGVELRKSDGAAAVLMAKRLDEQAAEIAVLKSDRQGDAIEKRARTEFPNVALATATSMLKTAAQLGLDTDAGKDVIKSLGAMNKATNGAFKSLGSVEAPEVSGGVAKARTDFNAEVNKIMGRDKIGMADAMSKARVEQPALFAEAYPETAEASAEDEA